MKHFSIYRTIFTFLFLASFGLLFPCASFADASRPKAIVIPIKGEINKGLTYILHRGLETAVSENASLIILEIDTNGGRLDATEEMMQMLLSSPIPTVSYIHTKAFSAGAFLAVATDRIYMSPASVIGAATPVSISPTGGVQSTNDSFEEKITSGTRALIKTAAQHKGHPDLIVSAMVDRDVEIEGVIKKEKLLTLTNLEAESEQIALSRATVGSMEEILANEKLEGAIVIDLQPSWSEDLALFVTNSGVAGVLMMLGLLGIYLEFKTPGFGLGGIVGLLCFALFFWGHRLAGLAGMEELILFVIGFILLTFEIFVIPGFGLAGVGGIFCLFAALLLGMIRHPLWSPGPIKWDWQTPDLSGPVLSMSIGLIGSVAGIVLLSKYLPKTTFWSKIALTAEQSALKGYTTKNRQLENIALGSAGIAMTTLRPSGKAIFNKHQYDVLTQDDFIEQGSSVVVTKIKGNQVFVEQVPIEDTTK